MDVAIFCLLLVFICYFAATVTFAIAASVGSKAAAEREQRWWRISLGLIKVGVGLHVGFIILRAWVAGHFPTSNLFEFLVFFCFTAVCVLLFLFRTYPYPALGAFSMGLVVALLMFAPIFPHGEQLLQPALQSYWLWIHVPTAALGQGAFLLGSVASFLYLVRSLDPQRPDRRALRGLETIWGILCAGVGYALFQGIFRWVGYQQSFVYFQQGEQQELLYQVPALLGPKGALPAAIDGSQVLWEIPMEFAGIMFTRLNAILWAILVGAFLYTLLRLVCNRGGPLSLRCHRIASTLPKGVLGELSYRAIAIGYPLFTLGALLFAMLWAHEAWARFWAWDAKETWSFIIWLFYSAYLHLRLSRGWHGKRSAWIAVAGLGVILINVLLVNLIMPGLHSYAGAE